MKCPPFIMISRWETGIPADELIPTYQYHTGRWSRYVPESARLYWDMARIGRNDPISTS